MNTRNWAVVLGVVLIGSLAGCASQPTPSPKPLQPVPLDSSAYSKKVDTVVVVLDAASSTDNRYRKGLDADRAQAIVSLMNQMIPALDYRAELVAFDSGSCLSCDEAVVLYGPASYNRAEFEAGLAGLKTAGRVGRARTMSGGTAAGRAVLQGDPGRVALIVVTDSENILHGRAAKTAQKLKGVLGDRLCIYPIQMDRDCDGRKVMEALAGVGGCGFAVSADDISSPHAMADYVTQVFLAPAPPKVAAVPVAGVPDADGDGVPDSRDRCPNTPNGVKVNADGCWELRGVYFDSDQALIKETNVLDEAVAILRADPIMTVEVHGHTDSTASVEHNQGLSETRARAVRDYFIKQGIAPERIRAKGFGESRPAAFNGTAEGRAMNRRVELHPDRHH